MLMTFAAMIVIGLSGQTTGVSGYRLFLFAPGKPVVQFAMVATPIAKAGGSLTLPAGGFAIRMQLSRNVVDWLADADEHPTFDGRIFQIDAGGRLRTAINLQKIIISSIRFPSIRRATGGNSWVMATLTPQSHSTISPLPSTYVLPPDTQYTVAGCDLSLGGKALGGDPLNIVLQNSASTFGAVITGGAGASAPQQTATYPGGILAIKMASTSGQQILQLRLTDTRSAPGPTGGIITTTARTVRISRSP